MFIGRYYHTVEAKGRVSLPKPLRTAGRTKASTDDPAWIITRGFEGGLLVFLANEFEQRLAELADRTFTKKRDRDFLRLMANDAQLSEVDGQGRLLIPQPLQDQAKIKKEVVIVGSFQYIELWDVETYHSYLDEIEPEMSAIAEAITKETT